MTITSADINTGKIDERCVNCFLKSYHRLFRKFQLSAADQKTFLDFFYQTIQSNKHLLTPEIQQLLNTQFARLTGIYDPFEQEKEQSNRIALELYNVWKPKVLQSLNPFDFALRLSIAGNIMDYGAYNNFNLEKTITKVLNADFAINHTKMLQEQIQQAKKVLFLGDNAGEIVFDRLLLEVIRHRNVTFAVKSGPALNDATKKDAVTVGMHKIARIIDNGFNAPSTILRNCSTEFLSEFKTADLIIAKGQGNLEGLFRENDPRIFFLLMVKCELVSEMLGVGIGDFVVLNKGLHHSNKN